MGKQYDDPNINQYLYNIGKKGKKLFQNRKETIGFCCIFFLDNIDLEKKLHPYLKN